MLRIRKRDWGSSTIPKIVILCFILAISIDTSAKEGNTYIVFFFFKYIIFSYESLQFPHKVKA